MHLEREGAPIQVRAIRCDGCEALFVPKRPWQRFHSTACRNAWHAEHGHRGTVKSVRRLKRGWSVTVHMEDAGALELGTVVQMVRRP